MEIEEEDNSSKSQSEDQFKLVETSEDKGVELEALESREDLVTKPEEYQEALPLKEKLLKLINQLVDLEDLKLEI